MILKKIMNKVINIIIIYNKKLDNNSYQILCFFVIRKVGVIPKWFTKMYISNINYCIYKM